VVDIFIVQAARHVDRLLHVATVIEHVGQYMHLADRLILPPITPNGITARRPS